MDRKEFIKTCGLACIGSSAFIILLQGCTVSKSVECSITGEDLIVPLSDFETGFENKRPYKKYLIVRNDILAYPVCVFRLGESAYAALWMRCTHQGTELQVFGDQLQCPAHGSEFNNRGELMNGPADKPLRSFPVKIEGNQLKISLKAV